MPIYEYCCPECNIKFELLRSISQSGDGAPCPQCQNKSPRAMSRFASFSKGDNGMATPVGGSSCGGCSSPSCGTCGG